MPARIESGFGEACGILRLRARQQPPLCGWKKAHRVYGLRCIPRHKWEVASAPEAETTVVMIELASGEIREAGFEAWLADRCIVAVE